MILGRYRQQPGEKRKRGVDYTEFLEEGEEISNVTAEVSPTTDPPFEISSIVVDPEEEKEFAYFAEGGIAGNTYTVEFTVFTSGGQRKQDTVEFDVEEDE